MPQAKVALSWADLLLILLISGLGAGSWLAAAALAQQITGARAPSEQAHADSMGVPQMVRDLEGAEADRSFAYSSARQLKLERIRHQAALDLARGDILPPVRGTNKPALGAGPDTLGRMIADLERSMRSESLLSMRLVREMHERDSVANSRRLALERMRDSAAARYRAQSSTFQQEQMTWTIDIAVLLALTLVGICSRLLRPRPKKIERVRQAEVIRGASLLIGLMFIHQIAGPSVLIGLLILGATVILFWKLLRAPT